MEVKGLQDQEELTAGYRVMRQLRDHLTLEQFLGLYEAMQDKGYRLFGLVDGGEIVAVAGVFVTTNLIDGRHVWVDDLVTDDRLRSRGYGRALLSFVHEYARQQGCSLVGLASGVQRVDAHRFYEQKMGYVRSSYDYKKGV